MPLVCEINIYLGVEIIYLLKHLRVRKDLVTYLIFPNSKSNVESMKTRNLIYLRISYDIYTSYFTIMNTKKDFPKIIPKIKMLELYSNSKPECIHGQKNWNDFRVINVGFQGNKHVRMLLLWQSKQKQDAPMRNDVTNDVICHHYF